MGSIRQTTNLSYSGTEASESVHPFAVPVATESIAPRIMVHKIRRLSALSLDRPVGIRTLSDEASRIAALQAQSVAPVALPTKHWWCC